MAEKVRDVSTDMSGVFVLSDIRNFGNVLSKQLLIGSVPRYRIRSAKVGPKRVYSNEDIRIEHISLRKGLNKDIINEFLKKYKNPVFIDFARNLINA